MTTRKEADSALAVYLDNLTIQLRMLDVPGGRIGQILAEVETHVADTGLGPVDAFGEAGEYASTYVAEAATPPELGGSRGWSRDLAVVAVCVLAMGSITEGAFHLTGSVDLTARLLGTSAAAVAVAVVVVHLLFALLASHTAGSAKPRTFTSRYMVLGSLTYMAGLAVLVLIPVLVPTGPTMASVPGWALVVAGLLVAFVSLLRTKADRVVDPRG